MSETERRPMVTRWTVQECDFGEALPLMDGTTICPSDGAVNLTIEGLDPESGRVFTSTAVWLSPEDAKKLSDSLRKSATRGALRRRAVLKAKK